MEFLLTGQIPADGTRVKEHEQKGLFLFIKNPLQKQQRIPNQTRKMKRGLKIDACSYSYCA